MFDQASILPLLPYLNTLCWVFIAVAFAGIGPVPHLPAALLRPRLQENLGSHGRWHVARDDVGRSHRDVLGRLLAPGPRATTFADTASLAK